MTLTPAEVDAIIAMACALPPQCPPQKTQQIIDDERAIARLENFIANKAPGLIRRHNEVAKEWRVMKEGLKRVNELKKRVSDVEGQRDTALAALATKETELQKHMNELTSLRASHSQ
ncbi:hypothetical protein J4E83_011033 [Alternaria metachromatica]|uniref:uncharacterized protein n=1 Tax=Alternaria metachromatica TaxID=283354 RepID=UPI0020C359DF|nr:uncharacterized protein J4E83_011033 [Alternaria metachromatica]KAI4604680.1 hypothetical protein J4E83_011033 [Alternaria metachromatica]